MGLLLLIFLFCLPILEIFIFVTVSNDIGLLITAFLFVLTTIVGFTLLRLQGLSLLTKAKINFKLKKFPTEIVFDGLCIFCAGVLLILPGFFTDAIGLFVYIPLSRKLLKVLGYQFIRNRTNIHSKYNEPYDETDKTIINGDFHDITQYKTCNHIEKDRIGDKNDSS